MWGVVLSRGPAGAALSGAQRTGREGGDVRCRRSKHWQGGLKAKGLLLLPVLLLLAGLAASVILLEENQQQRQNLPSMLAS